MEKSPLRVLCLDIEGGYGGSSRSLYYLLKHVDRSLAAPEVWCKREGPVQALYRELGIPVRVEPDMPKVSSLPRFSRSLFVHTRHCLEFWRARDFRARLAREASGRFDVVHCNHEALYLLARWLRLHTKAALVMHHRTQIWNSWFARRQARIAVAACQGQVFITGRERENVARLCGSDPGGNVIFNVAELPAERPAAHGAVPRDGRFTVACLSNYSWLRGIDRLVDVARALKGMGRADVRFVMAGKTALSRSLPGELGRTAARGGDLADYATQTGVGDMFLFLGHVSEPERVLAAASVLAKPSREDNPWGRDILEALGMGLPVLACGTMDTFVTPGETGFLYPHGEDFDSGAMARDIAALADDPGRTAKLARAARERVADLCHGPSRAADLVRVWEDAARAAGRSPFSPARD
ncbi:glycosyltransferase family 4 protein [Desulfocurvus sp. DL9XJH121]